MISFDGLVSGIDTSKIIEGLLQIQQRQIEQLNQRKETVVERQSAFKGIEAKLLNLRTSLSRLTRVRDSVFDSRAAGSSAPEHLTAAASSTAAVGQYTLSVNGLARAHQIASQGFSSAEAAIGKGTFTIDTGTGQPTTITVDATNNTLRGLADAINSSGAAVTASIINDGSGSDTAYRLVITSNKTGTANAISITSELDGGVEPDFDGDPLQQAADASIKLGSGPGALTITHSTNQMENVIDGVTLDLKQANPDLEITLNVSRNTKAAQDAIKDFVDAVNELFKHVDQHTRFDAETNEAGVLLGNSQARSIQDQIRREVLGVVPGAAVEANRLTAVGVSVNDRGHLVLNSSRLEDALNGRLEGVGEREIKQLFGGLFGSSDHPGVEFLGGSIRTRDTDTPYQVVITQAAGRAAITGAGGPLPDVTTIGESNNQLQLTVDGHAISVTLESGDYSRSELAAYLQQQINAAPDMNGRSVAIGLDNDRLTLTSDSFGSQSQVTITGGSALGTLQLDGTESDHGQDVAGHFVIDGQIETASGSGRVLTGNMENAHTADLQVRVMVTAAQVAEGVAAEMSVSRGIGARLDQVLGAMLDPVTGRLKTVDEGFNGQIRTIEQTIDRRNAMMDSRREALLRQFAALESTISQLQSTGSFLDAQLMGLIGRPQNR